MDRAEWGTHQAGRTENPHSFASWLCHLSQAKLLEERGFQNYPGLLSDSGCGEDGDEGELLWGG